VSLALPGAGRADPAARVDGALGRPASAAGVAVGRATGLLLSAPSPTRDADAKDCLVGDSLAAVLKDSTLGRPESMELRSLSCSSMCRLYMSAGRMNGNALPDFAGEAEPSERVVEFARCRSRESSVMDD
jgi:hypothetical protein